MLAGLFPMFPPPEALTVEGPVAPDHGPRFGLRGVAAQRLRGHTPRRVQEQQRGARGVQAGGGFPAGHLKAALNVEATGGGQRVQVDARIVAHAAPLPSASHRARRTINARPTTMLLRRIESGPGYRRGARDGADGGR